VVICCIVIDLILYNIRFSVIGRIAIDLFGNNQSQRFETEDEYNTLKHTVDKGEVKDKGEGQLENNVYDSSLGACDGVDPTYNSIKIGPVNNDTTYDHTSNIVQKQVLPNQTHLVVLLDLLGAF
jgi:hypothetical protein